MATYINDTLDLTTVLLELLQPQHAAEELGMDPHRTGAFKLRLTLDLISSIYLEVRDSTVDIDIVCSIWQKMKTGSN